MVDAPEANVHGDLEISWLQAILIGMLMEEGNWIEYPMEYQRQQFHNAQTCPGAMIGSVGLIDEVFFIESKSLRIVTKTPLFIATIALGR